MCKVFLAKKDKNILLGGGKMLRDRMPRSPGLFRQPTTPTLLKKQNKSMLLLLQRLDVYSATLPEHLIVPKRHHQALFPSIQKRPLRIPVGAGLCTHKHLTHKRMTFLIAYYQNHEAPAKFTNVMRLRILVILLTPN